MKKFKFKFKALAAAVAAVVVAVPCAVTPVFANSGMRYEYGQTGTGVIERNEQSVLAVESEKLTFDIVDFPDYPFVGNYKSTVTAEYKFVNTSDVTVHTQMAFPIGNDANFYGEPAAPEISLNGETIAAETRYTYGRYEAYKNFSDAVKKIYDGWYEDEFFNPDLPVTKFTATVETKKYDEIRLEGAVTCGDGARYYAGSYKNDMIYLSFGYYTTSEDFYVFGDLNDFSCEWQTTEYVEHVFTRGEYVPCEREFSVEKKETVTLKEFVLQNRAAGSKVSEADWYNAAVGSFGDEKAVAGTGFYNYFNFRDKDFLAWYVYDIEIAAGESAVNKIVSPIFPNERDSYKPSIYQYEYYLSPAASWKSFGTLEVVVNTDYYLLDPPVAFEKCEGGYRAVYDGLPQGELVLVASTSENPEYQDAGTVIGIVFMVIIALIFICAPVATIIWAIVYSVKHFKKNKPNA